MNPVIFESDDVSKSCPVSSRTINRYGGTTCRPSFSRVNPDTIGCVWTGEFDFNTLCVDGKFWSPERKSGRFKNIQMPVNGALKIILKRMKDVKIKCLANYLYLFYFCK